MLGRLRNILNSLVVTPSEDAASPAQAEQNFRNIVWAERQNVEAIRNADRLAWFCGVTALLKMPGVPEWMGPRPQARLAIGADTASSQPVPAPSSATDAARKPPVHLVSTSKKAVAK